MTLAQLVKLNYNFLRFSNGEFTYASDNEAFFKIRIPLEEVGNGTLLSYEKGIVLMKWIRKELKLREQVEETKND